MAHFAELDDNNIVIRVLVIPSEEEHRGNDFLSIDLELGGRWIQTSYNTKGGRYYNPDTNLLSIDQSRSFRKNYAGPGFLYDEIRDAFIPPKPFDSWNLNEDTCLWEAPIPMPNDGKPYAWDEDAQAWTALNLA